MAEGGEVEGAIPPVGDPFGEAAPDGRGLLEAVTREPVGEEEVPDLGMGADDHVVVERAEVVVAGPEALDLHRLEAGREVGDGGPDGVFPFLVAGVEVVDGDGGVVFRADAAEEEAAFGAAEGAGGGDGQRHGAGRRVGRVEDEEGALAGFHGEVVEVRGGEEGFGAGARGVDEGAAGDVFAGGEADAGDAVAVAQVGGGFGVGEFGAGVLRGGAEGGEEAHVVEPAFAGEAEGAEAQVFDVHEGVAVGDFRGRQEGHVGAEAFLDGVVAAEDGLLPGVRGEEEVAPFGEMDGGAEAVFGAADDFEAELADLDVQRVRELGADAGGGEGGGGEGVGGVAFEDEDGAGEALFRLQEVGGGGADDGAAHDDDVVGGAHGQPFAASALARIWERVSRGVRASAPTSRWRRAPVGEVERAREGGGEVGGRGHAFAVEAHGAGERGEVGVARSVPETRAG